MYDIVLFANFNPSDTEFMKRVYAILNVRLLQKW